MVFVGAGLLAFSRLNVEAYPNPAPVILEITAYGPGVPDDLRARMFEPFERLDASRREASTGTGVGLGLAVVKGFLYTMGGSVVAADTPGGGLTMRVALPAAAMAGSVLAAGP